VVTRLDLLPGLMGVYTTPARRRVDPRVAATLAQCLGRLRLVEHAIAELAASQKGGLPPALAHALRVHNRLEAERELHHVSALLSRLLAPVGLP
jgi:hypothetical protein